MKALQGCSGLALENERIAQWLHAEDSDTALGQNRQDLFFETVDVGVHNVERHLDSIEGEAVLRGGFQHSQMNVGTLMACETDKSHLASFLRLGDGFDGSAFGENAIRIGIANTLVALEEA